METIWHITPDGQPARPGTEGFVHASFTSQVAGTLALHFAQAARVVLLRLDPASIADRLVVEPSRDGQPFPHLYGPVAPQDVVEQITVTRRDDGRFDLTPLGKA